MKLTLKTQSNDHHVQPPNPPINTKNNKKIIIDRLYSKKTSSKSAYNPEDVGDKDRSRRICGLGTEQGEGDMGRRGSQETMLLSSFKKEEFRIFQNVEEALTQPSSNVFDPTQLSAVSFGTKKKEFQNGSVLINSCTREEQQCFNRIFSQLKVRYRPINPPEPPKKIQRNLITQLYAIQAKQSTHPKYSHNLTETAQFGVPKLQLKHSNIDIKKDISKQSTKQKQKSNQMVINLQLFPKENPVKTGPTLYQNYQNFGYIGGANRGQVSRRAKTQVSLLCREGMKVDRGDEGYYCQPAGNGHERAFSHNHRLLRAAPRSHTERAVSHQRQIGAIRRQASKTDLLKNHSLALRPYPPTETHTSRQKLQQIRQQLNHIYNSRNAPTPQIYPSKIPNARSHCYLPHNSSSSSIMSGNYGNQMEGRNGSRNGSRNGNGNQGRAGMGRIGGYGERGCPSRVGHYGNNYNHRLLLERSRNGGN